MGLCVSKREYEQIVQEKQKLQKENEQLKSQIINTNKEEEYNPKLFYDIIIYIHSINEIIKGWKIEFSSRMDGKYKEFTKDEVVFKIGVIGNSNKGKSFILSKISGFNLPSGTSVKTQGLSIKFPELKKYPDKKIALLDSAGLETPVLLEKKEIVEQNEKIANENIVNKNNNKNLQKKIELFKEESRDKIITELFLQNYIIYNSDIILLIVGILTYSEQKLLNKVKSELIRANQDKTLYVIHNLMTFTTKKQVEDYIKNILLKSATFNLEKQIIPNGHSECYYEKSKKPLVKHLFFAYEGSEAGNYYNKYTLEYLEKAYITIYNVEPFDVLKTVKERFKIISKEILEQNEGKNEILFDETKKDVIKLIKPEKIKLKKCFIDELGFQNLKSNGYEPNYNCYKKGNEIIIIVEAPGDCTFGKPLFYRSEGYTFIRILGNKNKDKEPAKIESNIYNSRENGEFILDIPFKYEDFWFKKKDPIIENKNGLFIIKCELENDINN